MKKILKNHNHLKFNKFKKKHQFMPKRFLKITRKSNKNKKLKPIIKNQMMHKTLP